MTRSQEEICKQLDALCSDDWKPFLSEKIVERDREIESVCSASDLLFKEVDVLNLHPEAPVLYYLTQYRDLNNKLFNLDVDLLTAFIKLAELAFDENKKTRLRIDDVTGKHPWRYFIKRAFKSFIAYYFTVKKNSNG